MLPRILDFLANQAIEAFDLGGSIDHPGENGRAREAAIRSFLADILPPDFGIDTGFVMDALGGISKQVDIVVYWKSRYPVLEVGSVKHFMIESVAAVFEIKADIGSEAVLREALENIASVKRLDRTGEGRNIVMAAYPRPLDPSQTQDQVFSFRVTSGPNLAGTGEAGYFYRTMLPVGDGRGLLFSDSVTDADRAPQEESNPPDGT